MADKYLIVGLGNPGKQYEGTRHNVGFMALEAWSRRCGIGGKTEKRFQAIVGSGRYRGHSLILAQPLTFMNLSGDAVRALSQYYDIDPARVLVVYDDAALPFGRIRIRPGGSAAGQKGMQSILRALGVETAIPRLRIGIGGPPARMAMPNYVLSRFDAVEQQDLPRILDAALDCLETWLDSGMDKAMERYNGLEIIPMALPEGVEPPG